VTSAVAIAANGFADGPAQALRDHLVARGHTVVTIFHPLTGEQGTTHVVTTYAGGERCASSTRRVPLPPPASYAADVFIPLRVRKVEAWFGFNPLACARGLAQRRLGRAEKVVLWSVDFVPDRFGAGTLMTRLYDRVDRYSCMHADARVELSPAALEARNRRHGLAPDGRTHVVPMGSWLGRVPVTSPDGFEHRRVVFLGHLVPRQGIDKLLEALALLVERGERVVADVIGSGPEEGSLREQARRLGLDGVVRFHGFVADHREVERLLAAGSVGVAPYRPGQTFTQYADPGKLKAYLAAGLPVVLTNVPPNAEEIAREGGAVLVPYDAGGLADALARVLSGPEAWRERRRAARRYAQRFDWAVLLPELLATTGLDR
jgi:glycosyltransferase involved in cell wall biosynthesis